MSRNVAKRHIAVLLHMVDGVPRAIGEIGVALGMCPRTMTGMVSMLKGRGMLSSSTDGRWALTGRGIDAAWSTQLDWVPLAVPEPKPKKHRPVVVPVGPGKQWWQV